MQGAPSGSKRMETCLSEQQMVDKEVWELSIPVKENNIKKSNQEAVKYVVLEI